MGTKGLTQEERARRDAIIAANPGMTQPDLGKLMGVTKSAVGSYMRERERVRKQKQRHPPGVPVLLHGSAAGKLLRRPSVTTDGTPTYANPGLETRLRAMAQMLGVELAIDVLDRLHTELQEASK